MIASFNVGGPWSVPVGLEQIFVQTMKFLQQRYPDLDAVWLCDTKLWDRALWHPVRNSVDGSDWHKFCVYATNPASRSGRETPQGQPWAQPRCATQSWRLCRGKPTAVPTSSLRWCLVGVQSAHQSDYPDEQR